jgi:hypothetical protein
VCLRTSSGRRRCLRVAKLVLLLISLILGWARAFPLDLGAHAFPRHSHARIERRVLVAGDLHRQNLAQKRHEVARIHPRLVVEILHEATITARLLSSGQYRLFELRRGFIRRALLATTIGRLINL